MATEPITLPPIKESPSEPLLMPTEVCPHCGSARVSVHRRSIGMARNFGPGPWEVKWLCGSSLLLMQRRPILNLSKRCQPGSVS